MSEICYEPSQIFQPSGARAAPSWLGPPIRLLRSCPVFDACMKTGERQTTRAVDVWRAAPDLPVFGVHVSIDGASWTCGAVRGWDVDGLADGLEALLA